MRTLPARAGLPGRREHAGGNRFAGRVRPVQPARPDPRPLAASGELRSLSQGLAGFTAEFDHLQELGGKEADQVVKAQSALVAA